MEARRILSTSGMDGSDLDDNVYMLFVIVDNLLHPPHFVLPFTHLSIDVIPVIIIHERHLLRLP